MRDRFPGFRACLAMMRKRDPAAREDGFHRLLRHAADHVPELIEAFGRETDAGLRCWLLELVGAAKSPAAFGLLADQLRSPDERLRGRAIRGLHAFGTPEARTLLWQARSFTLASPDETEAFRHDLDAVVAGQG